MEVEATNSELYKLLSKQFQSTVQLNIFDILYLLELSH